MTDRTQLETRWNEMQGRIEEAWGAITDDDLQRLEGRWDQVVATIRRRTGEAADTVEAKLDDLIDRLETSAN
jgi:uncharacterized protein YjbJ (UPF0337 family)